MGSNHISPDLTKLRAYTRTKLALAGQLRTAREALAALGREDAQRQCADLTVKLAEDRFTLAVLGQFKRGKSSLMNAIIGRELLPTGVLPLTSAITVLKYGPVERLVIQHEGWALPEEKPLSSLADYVTEKGNPENVKKVKTAYVELPVPFLRRGIEFVDTPGVGSAITANTAITYGFLPECDAVLFVTSVDTPLTSVELAFLEKIREYVDRIFFVVNKTDLVADDERDEVLGFVAATIQSRTGRSGTRVFPVSARLGLAARISGDGALYERSGVKALEEALAAFLSEEKSAAFLATVAQKALKILADEAAAGAFAEAALADRAQALANEKSAAVRRDPYAAAVAAAEAQAKLKALYAAIRAGQPVDAVTLAPANEAPPRVSNANAAAPLPVPEQLPGAHPAGPDAAAPDLAADLKSRSCPVCRHLVEKAWNFFAAWQYQLATEERAQAAFAAEMGFCPLHTWQLVGVSSPHGASVGYAQLAEEAARKLREYAANAPDTAAAAPAADGAAVRHLARDSDTCRVCAMLRRAEADYIERLAALIANPAGRSQYANSQGVCLRHLGLLIDAAAAPGSREFLLAHAAQRFEEDAEDMQSFAIKHEATRRGLQNRDEEDAYRRAITRIVGDRSVCIPWKENGEI